MFLGYVKGHTGYCCKIDRLHNMQTMEHMKPDRQKAISQETMDIYAPIANRIGFFQNEVRTRGLLFSISRA